MLGWVRRFGRKGVAINVGNDIVLPLESVTGRFADLALCCCSQFVTSEDIKILRGQCSASGSLAPPPSRRLTPVMHDTADLEQYYATTIDEMPNNLAEAIN